MSEKNKIVLTRKLISSKKKEIEKIYKESLKKSNEGIMIKVKCRKSDIGKIIGKNGKTINAIRSLVQGAAVRLNKKVSVDILE